MLYFRSHTEVVLFMSDCLQDKKVKLSQRELTILPSRKRGNKGMKRMNNLPVSPVVLHVS